jgi:hypothetical protein
MSTTKTDRHSWTGSRNAVFYSSPSQGFPPVYRQDSPPLLVAQKDDTVTHGSNIPDWRKRIALGQDATTTLSGFRYKCRLYDGSCDRYHNDAGGTHQRYLRAAYRGNLSAAYVGFNVPTTAASVSADNQARSKFLKRYIAATNTWRGGNFLAEIGETIHMLRHPVKALFDSTLHFAKRVRELRRIPVRNLRKTVSDTWLTWAFGVQPLIADCNDAASALNRLRTSKGGTGHDRTMISGHGRETLIPYHEVKALNMCPSDPGSPNRFYLFQKTDLTIRYRACIRAHLEDQSTVLEQFGLSPYDFAPAVWEAIPWSFFIDYFVNVQEMIDSCRLAKADVSWCYSSIRNAGTYNAHSLGMVEVAPDVGYIGGGGFYTLAVYVRRQPSSIPFPNWHFQVPGIESTKWLNIAALREQVFHATH